MQNSIANLYKKHKGKDVYIVGTGPSMRLFPVNFFKDKITIGLNQAYKYGRFTYGLTIHPYLIPIKSKDWNCRWVTKTKESDPSWNEHKQAGNIPLFYLFNNNHDQQDWSWLALTGASHGLYVGCGIQTGALHLAARFGAATAVLVGCDACSLDGDFHGHNQHTEFHGHSPNAVLREYMFYTQKVKDILEESYKMNIVSMNPFLGLTEYQEQYRLGLKKLRLQSLDKPLDIEVNKRTTPLTENYLQ